MPHNQIILALVDRAGIIQMATITETQNIVGAEVDLEEATRQLLLAAEKNSTKPLWTQMTRLNPPLPNPKCVPHVWEYKSIRPHLLQAGELVTEKQAERRVLMLTNPARGRACPSRMCSRSS